MYLDWQKNDRDYFAIDVETDSLSPTKIWCLCWENIKTGMVGVCRGLVEIRTFLLANSAGVFVAHNGIAFDFRVLRSLAGVDLDISCCADTMVLSQLYSPSLSTGHSLESWGEVLGRPKGSFSDFSRLSDDMVVYCAQDTAICAELFRKLTKVLSKIGFSEKSVDIQHRFMALLDVQHRNGFYFDAPKATALFARIRSLEETLKEQVQDVFPPTESFVRHSKVFTKDGRRTALYVKDVHRLRVVLSGDGSEYDAYESVPFNLGSPKQRVEKLLELGWKPSDREYTPRTPAGGGGTPTPFIKGKLAPSLEVFLEQNPRPEVEYIARWMSYNGRANMISTWLDEWNEDDSCIHGRLFVADTLRLRHRSPNTANIPAVRTSKDGQLLLGADGYFTYEARDCWTARPGRVLVGTDAVGLEARMLAHYLNRPSFTEIACNKDGDLHQGNADLVGISRGHAKTCYYAVMYGARAPKVASTLGISVAEGAIIRQTFLDKLGLEDIMKEAESEQRRGRVVLIDGSQVICPSPHAALNYRLQGGGARVMARASIILDGYIREDGLDALKVGDIHDEWQHDVAPGDASRHAIRSVQSIREAGESLGLNVPLDGTAKEGLTWAETH